jgi:hypothetical protein
MPRDSTIAPISSAARSNSSSESTGRALEREVARDLEERPAAAVVVAHLHGHRPRDAVGAQQQHVERVAALPRSRFSA